METTSALHHNTLHGLAEAIVAVPYQIGYYPKASLIAMCMRGDSGAPASMRTSRGSVALTARIDLGPPADHAQVLAALEPALTRAETDMVVLMAFEDGFGRTHDASVLLGKVGALAHSHGVLVTAAVRVRGRRWRRVDTQGRAEAWLDLPADEDVRAVSDYVLAGRAPAPDRRALEALLLPTCEELAESVARGCADASSSSRAATIGPEEMLGRAARTLASLMVRNDGNVSVEPAALSVRDLVSTIEALDDLRFRDAVLSAMIPWVKYGRDLVDAEVARIVAVAMEQPVEVDASACIRMAQAAAYAPVGRSAPWLSLVGYLAWHAGEGALANVVISAARDADPEHSLARLMDMALCQAVAPPRPV